jgi:hypothetical protein
MTNDDTACWQCGAPADPGCAYTQALVNRSQYADGLGVPVKRGRWGQNIVKVTVPRCEACQLRNYFWDFLSFTGLFVGVCIGGLQFPSKGITTIIGGFLGLIPTLLVSWCHRRMRALSITRCSSGYARPVGKIRVSLSIYSMTSSAGLLARTSVLFRFRVHWWSCPFDLSRSH